MGEIEALLTMEETARVLGGLHLNTVQRMCLRGEIPSVMVGRRRMVDPRDVRDYIEARKTNGPACNRQAVQGFRRGRRRR